MPFSTRIMKKRLSIWQAEAMLRPQIPYSVTSIVVSSQKGGVGKTTVSINLAHAFARAGVRTLLVDADPQGSVGLSLTRQSRLLEGFYDFLNDPTLPLSRLIVPTRVETFSLVPNGRADGYDTGAGSGANLSRVRSFLRAAEQAGFDLCVVDTAAGLFGVTGDVICGCQGVIIPQQAEPLGIRSLPKHLEGLERLRVMNPRMRVVGVCLTMIQIDSPESSGAGAALRQLLPQGMVMRTEIPRDGMFLRASARGLPVAAMEGGEQAGWVFDDLRLEVQQQLQRHGALRSSFPQ